MLRTWKILKVSTNFFHKKPGFLCHFLWSLLYLNIFIQTSNAENGFSNEWAVEIDGDHAKADEVAYVHGFVNHGKILEGEDFYLFAHPKLKKRSLTQNEEHHGYLVSHAHVKWAEQQRIKRRVKRDFNTFDPEQTPNDPKWKDMWYLIPSTQPSMRVFEAWQAGYSGANVSVTILDDGIERDHPDLMDNYDPLASGDINSHDSDPSPRLNPSNENRHGTRCAGEVAAVANNKVCSIGIAYNSKIGGVRMLDGQVTDAVEAASIGFNPSHVDIYSASWGPDDDGRTVDGPAMLARKAFSNGVSQGRNGKGSIFVWASGNGGRRDDNCNCDGYTDSIYTLSISSATQRQTKPWYSESCSSTLATTYSSGSHEDKQIVTTDLRHQCTMSHTGTSASAPLAAAVCALALEANPALTWRDMQHLVVQTARPDQLQSDDWATNGVNRSVSHAFGYGLMDAYGMVMKARTWTLVPQQRQCSKAVISENETPRIFTSAAPVIVPVQVVACDNGGEMLDRLEHVQAELTIHNERRGDLEIYLTSPSGTKSKLLGYRRPDVTSQGFNKWAFMTTHSWDENPRGRWLLELRDRNSGSVSGGYYRPYFGIPHTPPKQRTLSHYKLIMYGTKTSDWPQNLVQPSQHPTVVSVSGKNGQAADDVRPLIEKDVPATPNRGVATTVKHHVEGVNNCKIPLASGKGCLGHYHAIERVNEKGEWQASSQRQKTEEFEFEIEEEEVFEDEERFYNARVCRPCTELCHSCSGPKQCVQCVSGSSFQANDSSCVPVSEILLKSPGDKTIYILFLLVIGLAFVLVLLCRSRSKLRCFKTSVVSYKYLPDGEGSVARMTDVMEYHDEPEYAEDIDPKFSPFNGYKNGTNFISATPSKLLTADEPALLSGE